MGNQPKMLFPDTDSMNLDLERTLMTPCMIKVSERSAGDAEGAGVLPHLRLREHGGGGERGGPGGDHLGPGQHAHAGTPRQGEDTRPRPS
jgi:hypothetical protein